MTAIKLTTARAPASNATSVPVAVAVVANLAIASDIRTSAGNGDGSGTAIGVQTKARGQHACHLPATKTPKARTMRRRQNRAPRPTAPKAHNPCRRLCTGPAMTAPPPISRCIGAANGGQRRSRPAPTDGPRRPNHSRPDYGACERNLVRRHRCVERTISTWSGKDPDRGPVESRPNRRQCGDDARRDADRPAAPAAAYRSPDFRSPSPRARSSDRANSISGSIRRARPYRRPARRRLQRPGDFPYHRGSPGYAFAVAKPAAAARTRARTGRIENRRQRPAILAARSIIQRTEQQWRQRRFAPECAAAMSFPTPRFRPSKPRKSIPVPRCAPASISAYELHCLRTDHDHDTDHVHHDAHRRHDQYQQFEFVRATSTVSISSPATSTTS